MKLLALQALSITGPMRCPIEHLPCLGQKILLSMHALATGAGVRHIFGMSDFFRPEVRSFARHWSEVIAASAVFAFGLWWVFTGVGINRWLGAIFCLVGIGWGIAAFQRARFAQDGDGPGVVQLRERRLAYFGPLNGGVMDVAALTELGFEPGSHPGPSWTLQDDNGQQLAIPINATGAEALFDVFAALPGMETSDLLAVLDRTPDARVVLWQRTKPLLH